MQKSFRAVLLTLIVGILAFSTFVSVLAQGTVLADTGFRPQVNGFSFENYGNESKPVNLTPASMQKIFGDAVCKSKTNDSCVLSATAQVWMDKINADMNGGHCEGMAAVSSLISSGKLNLADLDPNAKTVQDLKADNPKVQEEIARWFATQYVPPTATSEIRDKTPNQLVDTMIDQLKQGTGPFTMGIYQANGQGGHAITPYSVVDMGNGVVRVMVYDNNYPNQERFIEVDRNANTWKYTGSTNPNEPQTEYFGDASTFNMTLTPVAARVTQPQQCDFCTKEGSTTTGTDAANPTVEPTVEGADAQTPAPDTTAPDASAVQGGCTTSVTTGPNANVVVTDSNGNKAGVVKGKAFSTIKGAIVLRPRSQGGLASDTPGAVVILPSGGKFSATVSGNGSNDVLVASCGAYQRVEGMSQEDGKPDTLLFPSDASSITVSAEPGQSLTVSGGYNNPDGEDYTYDVTNVTSETGGPIEVGTDPTSGNFIFESNAGATFDANFTSTDADGNVVENPLSGLNVDAGAGISDDFADAVSNQSPTFDPIEASDWAEWDEWSANVPDIDAWESEFDFASVNYTDEEANLSEDPNAVAPDGTEIAPTEEGSTDGTEIVPTEEGSTGAEVVPTEEGSVDQSGSTDTGSTDAGSTDAGAADAAPTEASSSGG